jgi:hypothetical protein
MQEGDAGTKSLYIPPIRPLSAKESYANNSPDSYALLPFALPDPTILDAAQASYAHNSPGGYAPLRPPKLAVPDLDIYAPLPCALPDPTILDVAQESYARNSSRTRQFAVPDPTILEKDLVHLYVDINSLYQFVP